MRRDLLPMLCCPVCRGNLALRVEREDAGDIVSGSLECPACPAIYPIEDGIPNLLPTEERDESPGTKPGSERAGIRS